MKYLAILGIVIALGIGGYILKSKESVTYVAPEKEIVTEEVVVNELDKRIADAQAAAMNDIETKAQAAYDALVAQELLKVEHNVTKAYREEVEARETDLSKEIGVY